MPKYALNRLGPDRFEAMAQALLEKNFRLNGALTQFGDGKDGAREATWSQPSTHPNYTRPLNEASDVPKEWVFQVKYHDIGLKGWGEARRAIEADLKSELKKLCETHNVKCHKYVMITNVPLTAVRNTGTRDKLAQIAAEWHNRVPEVIIWDATDVSSMLDADPGTRVTYLGEILPGDILQSLLTNTNLYADRLKAAMRAYLGSLLRIELEAKAEEAGDESGLPLDKIFIDLTLETDLINADESLKAFVINEYAEESDVLSDRVNGLVARPASFALLVAPHKSILLKGGPGVGKSTLTQFATLYHAARLVNKEVASRLAERLEWQVGERSALEALCEVRIPFRVELRRYAQWMSERSNLRREPFLGEYIAERVGKAASCNLTMDDIFFIAKENAILLIMDGLDEVPNPETRSTIFEQLATFIDRTSGEYSDVQLLLSTRPQGYRGEFKGFKPVEWIAQDLERDLFDRYCNDWLQSRIPGTDDREDARKRINSGMESPSVQQLAKTLLQTTVMLTIARRKLAIPHAREKLFERYVEVMFDREKNKETVKDIQNELLLLHERVGYELMKRMQSKTSDKKSLGHLEFSQLVNDIIANYGSKELGDRRIREIVEEIARVAKDRLCLLAGKGEDQSNIDFVIQSFREYFAAKYMAKHADGDAERVFDCLCRRFHFWGSVLQFYAAVQSKSQQKAWISEVDGTGVDLESIRDLVLLIQKRRALLRILPEFDRPRNSDIERALNHLFDISSRWTWASFPEACSLLKAFAPEHSIGILSRMFTHLSFDDSGSLAVELDLLINMSSKFEGSSVSQTLQDLLTQGSARDLVLELACSNNLGLDYREVTAEELLGVFHLRRFGEPERFGVFLERVGDKNLANMFISKHSSLLHFGFSRGKPFLWLVQIVKALFPNQLNVESSAIGFSFPPCLASIVDWDALPDSAIQRLRISGAKHATYFAAVCESRRDPKNKQLHLLARKEADAILAALSREHCQEELLGPSPSDFSSDDEWREWVDLATSLSQNEGFFEFQKLVKKMDLFWIVALSHPDHWDFFRPLAKEGAIEQARASSFYQVLDKLPHECFPLEIYRFADKPLDVPFKQLLDCFLNLFESCVEAGKRKLRYEWVLSDASGQEPVSYEEADNLMDRVFRLQVCNQDFNRIVLRALRRAKSLNVDKLCSFWATLDTTAAFWFLPRSQQVVPPWVSEVLSKEDRHRTTLAAWLLASSEDRFHPDLSTVVERLSRNLVVASLDDEMRLAMLDCLLALPITLGELEVWVYPKNVELLLFRTPSWKRRALRERLSSLHELATNPSSTSLLVKYLSHIVAHRRQFPREICSVALEALIRIEELTAEPLEDCDWQSLG